jgi:segregation and condensation protein B
MTADESRSLADQAAEWVPPWAREPSGEAVSEPDPDEVALEPDEVASESSRHELVWELDSDEVLSESGRRELVSERAEDGSAENGGAVAEPGGDRSAETGRSVEPEPGEPVTGEPGRVESNDDTMVDPGDAPEPGPADEPEPGAGAAAVELDHDVALSEALVEAAAGVDNAASDEMSTDEVSTDEVSTDEVSADEVAAAHDVVVVVDVAESSADGPPGEEAPGDRAVGDDAPPIDAPPIDVVTVDMVTVDMVTVDVVTGEAVDSEPVDVVESAEVPEPVDVIELVEQPVTTEAVTTEAAADEAAAAEKAEITDEELRGAVEAILLIIDEPATEMILAQVLEQPIDRVTAILDQLTREYSQLNRGFELRRVAGGWRLYTRPEYAAYVEKFVLDGQQVRLTQAALETLAVVAYKQPVTRSRISAIRGVNCDGVVRTLVARGLIEECGSEPDSGAFLYRTTVLFLEKLGLDTVEQLPPLAPFLPDDVDEIADAQR